MWRILKEARPIVLLELHGEQAAKVAWKVFDESGYRIYQMKAGYPRVPSLESLDWKAYLVAFPLEEER